MSQKNILIKKSEWLSHKHYSRIDMPDLTEEKIKKNKIAVTFNAAGLYDRTDARTALKDPTWVNLPFTFFEPASDIVVGFISFDAQPGVLQINFSGAGPFESTPPDSSQFQITIS